MDQLASKVSQEEPNWARMGHFYPLGAFLCAFLRIFTGFREQLCIFAESSWKNHKNQQIAPKIAQNTEKALKSAQNASRQAKNGPAGLISEHGWTKIGLHWATFAHFGSTFGHLGRSFRHFYAFLLGFREQLCIFSEN